MGIHMHKHTETKEGRDAGAKEDGGPQLEEYCYFVIFKSQANRRERIFNESLRGVCDGTRHVKVTG